jgi:hypothetical protein
MLGHTTMKRLTNIIILFFLLTKVSGQNLAPNPSFEDTLYCPFYTGSLGPIADWRSFGNSVDCFHTCASYMNIPNSPFGYQNARTGTSMVGLVSYVWQYAPGWPNYREYLGAKLLDSLDPGTKYYVSFYINCAGYLPGWQIIGANKIGARFSTVSWDSLNAKIPDNFSHVKTDSIVIDTVQWFKVSGSFIADSSYKYIVIGNFYDTLQTDTTIFGGAPFGGSVAYYYIEDVCVSTSSLTCAALTDIKENKHKTNLKVYPNPTTQKTTIEFDNWKQTNYTLKLFDIDGRPVRVIKDITSNKVQIDRKELQNGLYFFQLYADTDKSWTGKIILE